MTKKTELSQILTTGNGKDHRKCGEDLLEKKKHSERKEVNILDCGDHDPG